MLVGLISLGFTPQQSFALWGKAAHRGRTVVQNPVLVPSFNNSTARGCISPMFFQNRKFHSSLFHLHCASSLAPVAMTCSQVAPLPQFEMFPPPPVPCSELKVDPGSDKSFQVNQGWGDTFMFFIICNSVGELDPNSKVISVKDSANSTVTWIVNSSTVSSDTKRLEINATPTKPEDLKVTNGGGLIFTVGSVAPADPKQKRKNIEVPHSFNYNVPDLGSRLVPTTNLAKE